MIKKAGVTYLGNLLDSKIPKIKKTDNQVNTPYLGRTKGFYRDSGTEYKYVSKWVRGDEVIYEAKISRINKVRSSWVNWYPTLREAAIAVDKKLLECGCKPVNILKKKHTHPNNT